MKKILLLLFLILSLSLSSCFAADNRVVDMDNMLWKNPDFNIEATSTQLQNQNYNYSQDNKSDYYSSIIIDDNKYSCFIGLGNGHFTVLLFDDATDSLIQFYGDIEQFLYGFYDNPEKVKDKDYKYTMNVGLTESGQYYEYCQANNIEYPKTITFYGYVI